LKNLIIIGARGYGREVCDWASSCVGYGDQFTVKGFLDGKVDALEDLGEYPPILGNVEDYRFEPNDRFVVALGDPKWKRHYADMAMKNGGVPMTLVAKTATIGAHSEIGRGCLLLGNSRVSVNCKIGDFVSINYCVDIGHDATVGSYTHIGAFGFMGGYSKLGSDVTMHPRVSVLPHKCVGDGAILGAGSVCIRNVKPQMTVFGLPAKAI